MPMYFPPWDTDQEPNESTIKMYMDNLYGKFEPIEQARWNQSNIDSLFYAGEQRFINSYFNFFPTYNFQSFHFNFMQQPVNMVTGYQRQHRKSITYIPIEGSSQHHADDLTNVETYANTNRFRLEKFSQGCELSTIHGMVLAQPYLDFTDDPINGTLDLKIWPYNSFMVDPYFREPDMSDANFVWCQQYISKIEAKNYFPEKSDLIDTMSGFGNRYGKFYFLPENYNLARNDLLVLSHVWYKSKRKKKMVYNQNDGIAYDYSGKDEFLEEMIQKTGFFSIIEVTIPTWKLAVVLNENLMYQNRNPLGFDECPFVPIYWNYEPHIAQYDLRVRSLCRTMRDSQFLLNRRIIINHDISESSINTGWKRKENSIANEDELRYSGQGKDIIVKEGYEMSDIEKIQPNGVPPSDIELGTQLQNFIYEVSGVSKENFGVGEQAEKLQSGLAIMLKQGAGLMVLQKYFDQWDVALKLIGKIDQQIIQNNWSPAKIARIIGREPSPEFMNKTFSKYSVLVAEGLDTTIQKQQQFVQVMQLNEALGGKLPAKFILQNATIQGKDEIIKMMDEQEKMQSQMAQQQMLLEQTYKEAQIQNLFAKSTNEIGMSRERESRKEANVGLFEERMSEITQNRSMALKNKVEALEKLMLLIREYGEFDTLLKAHRLQDENLLQKEDERIEKVESRIISDEDSDKTQEILQSASKPQQGPPMQQQQQEQSNARSALL